MNLWVKRTGQLFIAVLFLMSCEDESFLLGFPGKEKFKGRYQELSLGSSVMLVDSVATNGIISPRRFLTGRYFDNAFGEVRSESYTEFYPTSRTQLDATSVLDSVVIQMRFDTYVYGSDGTSNEQFHLHELTEELVDTVLYYYNSSIAYNPTPISSVVAEVSYDTLVKNSTLAEPSQDTLLLKFKLSNSEDFALRLFDFSKNRVLETDSALFDQFRSEFSGLALVPDVTNSKVVGFNPSSSLSRVFIYYHTDTEDSLSRILTYGNVSFNRTVTDRSPSELAGLSSYQEFEIGNYGYIQSGSPVITQLDLTNFYQFADTIPNMVINSAELSVGSTGVMDGLEPPSVISVRLQNENNQFLNRLVKDDQEFLTGYEQLFLDGRYYSAGGDFNLTPFTSTSLSSISQGQSVVLSYLKSENRYTGFMTLFLQNLFKNKSKEDKIIYISLNALSPAIGKTVNRVVFDKSSVKLKIYYTIPVSDNL